MRSQPFKQIIWHAFPLVDWKTKETKYTLWSFYDYKSAITEFQFSYYCFNTKELHRVYDNAMQ